MKAIFKDLYQFSSYVEAINLTFHQYLLLKKDPVLFHTGNIRQASAFLPQLHILLAGIPLKYIFVSHFEADECGGLAYLLMHFPEAKPVCSEVTARQLSGFGISDDNIVKKPGEKLFSNDYELDFFSYPSEMHLWPGLLVMENKREIFFSSDLMLQFGKAMGDVIDSNWSKQISTISREQIPDPDLRENLQLKLSQVNPRFIATGHGPCIRLR